MYRAVVFVVRELTLFIRIIFRHRKLVFLKCLFVSNFKPCFCLMNDDVFIFKSSLRYIFVLNGLASMTWVCFLVKSTFLFSFNKTN